MKAKDVIIDKISWKDSRYFFFNRLRRLLAEEPFIKKIREFKTKSSVIEARSILCSFFQKETQSDWKCDEDVYKWLKSSEQKIYNQIEKEYSVGQIQLIQSILQTTPSHSLTILKGVIQSLSQDQIKELMNSITSNPPGTPSSSDKNSKTKNITKKSNKK